MTRRRGFSLAEALLCVALFGLLTSLVFVAFRDGTRTFSNLNVRQGLEGEARRCTAVLEQQLRQSDYGLLSLINSSSRQRMGMSGKTVSRDGVCYPSLNRWWEAASFDAGGRPKWDQYQVIYATLFNPGRLLRQVYRPGGAPYQGPMDNFTIFTCLRDEPKDNAGVYETHELSRLVEDFELVGDGATSSLKIRLILTDREAHRAGTGQASQQRQQVDLVVKLNNTQP